MKKWLSTLLATSAMLVVPLVQAQTPVVFDFANLTNGSLGNFLPSNGIDCTGGDKCSTTGNSALGGTLSFSNGGITVHATASYQNSAYGVNASVVQDHELLFNNSNGIGAGLGVYHLTNNYTDDNITAGEALRLNFNQAVTLSAIGLRDDGHNTSFNAGTRFDYSFDNIHWSAANLASSVALNHVGQDLYVRYASQQGAQFYLSSMTVAAVPEPETYAMLLAGLGLISLTARKRKSTSA